MLVIWPSWDCNWLICQTVLKRITHALEPVTRELCFLKKRELQKEEFQTTPYLLGRFPKKIEMTKA